MGLRRPIIPLRISALCLFCDLDHILLLYFCYCGGQSSHYHARGRVPIRASTQEEAA